MGSPHNSERRPYHETAKNTITTETHAFARYTHKPAFFAETGTPHNWLPAYVRARVAKALGCCDTLAVGRTVPCAY
jgi:hypothetical protein